MSANTNNLYRGERDDNADFKRDGKAIFFTTSSDDALEYGRNLIEANLYFEKLFDPAWMVYRRNGDWVPDYKVGTDFAQSEAFLHALYDIYDRPRVEAIYELIEEMSWSEVERPEIQDWLKSQGYDGFRCCEGNGETFAIFDADKIEVISRTYHPEDNGPSF